MNSVSHYGRRECFNSGRKTERFFTYFREIKHLSRSRLWVNFIKAEFIRRLYWIISRCRTADVSDINFWWILPKFPSWSRMLMVTDRHVVRNLKAQVWIDRLFVKCLYEEGKLRMLTLNLVNNIKYNLMKPRNGDIHFKLKHLGSSAHLFT